MTLALAPDVTLTETEGGSVLLDQRAGRYWMLNSTGGTALRLMLEGRTVRQTSDVLRSRTPEDAQRVENDVRELLTALRGAELVLP